MFGFFFRIFSSLRDVFSENASPRQLAGGLALGMLIGLVPKDNLTAATLAVLLCVFDINLAVGLFAALAFSWIGVLIDPYADTLGYQLLTWKTAEPLWVFLAGMPVLPWTAFNNTVVLGNLVIGLVALYPVYRLGIVAFTYGGPRIRGWLARLSFLVWIERFLWILRIRRKKNA